jgi:anti-anti-sigma regulatory factor
MQLSAGQHLLHDTPAPGVHVGRFTRPDMRLALDDPNIEDCPLYLDLRACALDGLANGQTLILNFGLVTFFPTVFYRFLLKVRETVAAAHGRLVLCGLTPLVHDGVTLFRGERLFDITTTEEQALARLRA